MKTTLKQLLVSCALFTLGASHIQAISVTQYVQQSGLPRIGNTLDFSNTGLTTLDGLAEILQNSPRVRSLNLSGNNLVAIPAGIFDNAPAGLITINLSNNQIMQLPQNIFSHTPNLTWLSLAHNQLQTLPTGIFNVLNNLRVLDLRDNNFNQDFLPKLINSIRSIPNLQELNGEPKDQALGTLRQLLFSSLKGLTAERILQNIDLYRNRLGQLPQDIRDLIED